MYNINNLKREICIGNLKQIYEVDIDVSAWIILYNTPTIQLYFIPPNKTEEDGYFVNSTIINNHLIWTITETDIATLGRGRAVIILNGNNKIKKSDTITVVIQ